MEGLGWREGEKEEERRGEGRMEGYSTRANSHMQTSFK